ncbi:MAG: Cna B-type domain-containing protein, partial [Clostridiaceae bacterium]
TTISATTTALETNNWTFEFKDVPKYKNGVLIDYTVKEEPVTGYTGTYVKTDPASAEDPYPFWAITNTHIPEVITLSGEKIWDDAKDQDGLRPDYIVVNLNSDKATGVIDSVKADISTLWKYEFKNLPKYSNGLEIKYTITEDPITNYTTLIDGTTITNTHIPETTTFRVTKIWEDKDNQDGYRPKSIIVNLFSSIAKGIVSTIEITEDMKWTYVFTNLPKYSDGKLIYYSVAEHSVDNYTGTVDGNVITNTHTPDETSVTVVKDWEDGDNQDGIRPDFIEVRLESRGAYNGPIITLNKDNNWTYTWKNLPLNYFGDKINYTVDELSSYTGYTTTTESSTPGLIVIKNEHIPETINIKGAKTWNDGDNQDGIRPTSINVLLLDGNKIIINQSVTGLNGWAYSFNDLPKYRNGVEIQYSISEVQVNGYEMTKDGNNLINTHIPETVNLEGVKVWDDANNQDGIRPKTITINLHKNGSTDILQSITIDKTSGGLFEFADLPRYEAGAEITYSITEDAVSEYQTEITITTDTTKTLVTINTTIKNSYTPKTLDIPVTKVWDDNNNQDNVRPAAVTYNLYSDASPSPIKSVQVSAAENWSYTFKDYPMYSNGTLINYRVTEDPIDNYTITSIVNSDTGTTITNKHTPDVTSFVATKLWDDAHNQDGIRPSSIVVQLLADGKPVADGSVTLDVNNNWTDIWTELPLNASGSAITYTVEEIVPSGGYTVSYDYSVKNSVSITNKHTPILTSVPVTKIWDDVSNQDGVRPQSITLHLFDETGIVATATLSPADSTNNTWSYSFDTLPKFRDGKEIEYGVLEEKIQGYTTSINGLEITNTHVPEVIDIPVSKTWDDKTDQDGMRPAEIVLSLFNDVTTDRIGYITLNPDNTWMHTFTGLPKYNNGKLITYSVDEEAFENLTNGKYTKKIVGYSIINLHVPEVVEIPVTKTWDDNDNQDGKRPEFITVTLYADTIPLTTHDISLSDGWAYKFTNLPKYKNKTLINYTVSESTIPGYTTEITDYAIKNTHTPELAVIKGTKTWDDNNNQDGMRPETIKVNLLDSGNVIASQDAIAADNWSYSFEGFPKYRNGVEIVYTVTEDVVPNYETPVITGYDITNKHVPLTTEISGTKTWTDNNNQDGVRPTTITVDLMSDKSTVPVSSLTIGETESWKYDFTDLPVYENGSKIIYSVIERPIAGYSPTYTADGITNTHIPDVTSYTVRKLWDDNNNQDGIRPASIKVQLMGNTPVGDEVELNDGNKWTYTWNELPLKENGTVIKYSVQEIVPSGGYTASYDTNTPGLTTITNKHTPLVTTVDGEKTWVDNENQDGLRPASIKIYLMSDQSSVPVDSKIVSAAEQWKYSFTELPKYSNGVEIKYTIHEEPIAEYTPEYIGYNVTNTHVPGVTSYKVRKIWDDNDNQDGLRPDSIMVQLSGNEPVGAPISLNAS